jgi:hypothetical protein
MLYREDTLLDVQRTAVLSLALLRHLGAKPLLLDGQELIGLDLQILLHAQKNTGGNRPIIHRDHRSRHRSSDTHINEAAEPSIPRVPKIPERYAPVGEQPKDSRDGEAKTLEKERNDQSQKDNKARRKQAEQEQAEKERLRYEKREREDRENQLRLGRE